MRISNATATNQADTGFSSMAERAINTIISTIPGQMPPPLLPFPPEEDLGRVLDTPITVFDDDTDEKIERKTVVAEMKERLREHLAAGGDAGQLMAEYREGLVALAAERNEAQAEYFRLRGEDGEQAARLYLEEKNKEFAGRGIMPLSVGKTGMREAGGR